MSTFGGRFEEIPGISVDRFNGANFSSEAFFLSHCHTDHMIGLNSRAFQENLKEENLFIYVSHVSKAIMKQLHPNIESQVRELDFHNPTTIYLKSGPISVTLIPSGHCPGSVMFLFECDKTILYTGDYRMKSSDVEKIRAFYDSHGKLKNIHSIYLDTTFFFKTYLRFPSREESLARICEQINEWISNGENYIIDIQTPGRYGYEYVFMEIFKRVKMPVHIGSQAYEFYSLIPDMDKTVTLNGSKTQLHHSCGVTYKDICNMNGSSIYHTKIIYLSAMKWKNDNLQEGILSDVNGVLSVCYSTHASYEEGVHLINFLKPKKVLPSVLRYDKELNDEIYLTIENLLKYDEEQPAFKKPKLFNIEELQANRKNLLGNNDCENEIDDLFGSILESPPKNQEFDIV